MKTRRKVKRRPTISEQYLPVYRHWQAELKEAGLTEDVPPLEPTCEEPPLEPVPYEFLVLTTPEPDEEAYDQVEFPAARARWQLEKRRAELRTELRFENLPRDISNFERSGSVKMARQAKTRLAQLQLELAAVEQLLTPSASVTTKSKDGHSAAAFRNPRGLLH